MRGTPILVALFGSALLAEPTVAQFRRFLDASPEVKARHAYGGHSPRQRDDPVDPRDPQQRRDNVGFRVDRTLPPPSQQTAAAAIRELEKLEHQLAETYKAGDCAGWGAMLAPEWSVTHITAEVITKAQALEMCAATKGQIAQAAIDDIRVRVFGDAAVVTGRTTASTSGANPVTVTLRFTDFFVRRSGRWLVVASHATRLGG